MDEAIRVRPSLWHCLWGLPFLLIGGGFFFHTIFHGITHLTDSLTQVVVPGSAELHLLPGLYTVFLEDQSTVNGKIYSTTQSISGLECHISSAQNGSAIAMRSPSTNTTYSVNGRSGRSVLEFSIQQDGKYKFACDYGESTRGPEAIVAVGSGVGDAISSIVIGGLGEFFGGIGAALAIVAVVYLKREREKRRLLQLKRACP